MTAVERLIAKLERAAADPRTPEDARKGALRDAAGYRAALHAKRG